jgi:hypothetical protein
MIKAKVKTNITLREGLIKAGTMLDVKSVNVADGKVVAVSPFNPDDVIELATEAVTLIQVLKNTWAALKMFALNVKQVWKSIF